MVALDEHFHRDGAKARSRRRCGSEAAQSETSLVRRITDVACPRRRRDTSISSPNSCVKFNNRQSVPNSFVSLCRCGENRFRFIDHCSLIFERIADAYGNTLICTGPGLDGLWFTDDDVQSDYGANENIYCGYRFDPETQLYYVRNRTYNPALGRWIQRDPIGHSGGINLYGYADGGPAIAADWSALCPSGFKSISPHDLINYAQAHGGAYQHRRITISSLANQYPESGLSSGHMLFRGLPAATRVNPVGRCRFTGLCARISATFSMRGTHPAMYGAWRAVDSENSIIHLNIAIVEYSRKVYWLIHYLRKVDVLRQYQCFSTCNPYAHQPILAPYTRYVYGGSMLVRSGRADRLVRGGSQIRLGSGAVGGPGLNVYPTAGRPGPVITGEPPEPPQPPEPGDNEE